MVGTLVKIREDNDNENYNEYRDLILRVTHVATNENEHPGYDSSMEGEMLVDLVVDETNEDVPFSLYEYEFEEI